MSSRSEAIQVRLESCSPDIGGRSFLFAAPVEIVVAHRIEEVAAAMKKVEGLVELGFHAAGYVAYEAGAAFNTVLPVRNFDSAEPLLWFGIFDKRQETGNGSAPESRFDAAVSLGNPLFSVSKDEYVSAVKNIKKSISRGETYQVNYTFRALFPFSGEPLALYKRICDNQKSAYCAFIDTGDTRIVSASPELFFSLKENIITMKPMKGTSKRRPDSNGDGLQKELLKKSEKERAENLMIVDLVRNDLGVVAETGSVQVRSLFEVETYPTVHQMTSTVQAVVKKEITVSDVFSALFPCGSVTGAPKRRTMEIIGQLEPDRRGVYCGAIGYISPGKEAVFSVAIRTVVVDSANSRCTLGIGGGITWDSDPVAEYDEAVSKSVFMTRNQPEFGLIETVRRDDNGYLMLDRHLARLAASAAYFGFRFDQKGLAHELGSFVAPPGNVSKVRVVLNRDGAFTITAENLTESSGDDIALIAISAVRQDPDDPFLYHKTTNRQLYDEERKKWPDCYDVIFLNSRDEVTEGSFNSIVISRGGQLFTPALECGLLPGVLRQELLEVGAVSEAVLTTVDLQAAEKIWLVNSVRGWQECRIQQL